MVLMVDVIILVSTDISTTLADIKTTKKACPLVVTNVKFRALELLAVIPYIPALVSKSLIFAFNAKLLFN